MIFHLCSHNPSALRIQLNIPASVGCEGGFSPVILICLAIRYGDNFSQGRSKRRVALLEGVDADGGLITRIITKRFVTAFNEQIPYDDF